MSEGDLVNFMCIGDSPQYSQDGEWRLGLFLMQIEGPSGYAKVFYRGNIFKPQLENCRKIGEQ